jgi:hypothetical protein
MLAFELIGLCFVALFFGALISGNANAAHR